MVDPTAELRREREAINRFFHTHLVGGPEAEDPRRPYADLMGRVQSKMLSPPCVQTGFTLKLRLDNGTGAAGGGGGGGTEERTERWLLTLQYADGASQATQLAIDSITAYPLNTADLKLVSIW